MSRKFKRFLSIMMVAAMVIAMAAACGKKEEAADPEKKEDTKVEAEKETEPAEAEENAADEQQKSKELSEDDEEKNEFGFTADQIESLLISIQMAVLTEYLEPNQIDPSEFNWPDSLAVEWRYLDSRLTNYEHGMDVEMPDDVPAELDYSLMKVVYDAIITWFEDNNLDENCYQNMGNLRLMLDPIYEKIPSMISF